MQYPSPSMKFAFQQALPGDETTKVETMPSKLHPRSRWIFSHSLPLNPGFQKVYARSSGRCQFGTVLVQNGLEKCSQRDD
jgi:hypothetical protein